MANVRAEGAMTVDWIASAPDIAIPVYQRDYRWTQETCHQLLDDIRAISAAEEGHTHFIGSILASKEDDGSLTLVDGQQRVTTLMLMMAALRDLALPSDEELSAHLTDILRAPGDPARPRLQPHEQHAEVVRALMTTTPTSLGDSTFELNYAFFLGELVDDWRRVWAGLGRLEHVGIALGPKANSQQIFASLNSTGARLSDDELIHNYIHMDRSRDRQEALERDVWLPVEDATRGATREFWRDFLVATASAQPDFGGDFGVYKAFAKRYPDPRRDLTAEVGTEWVRFARLYGVLLSPDLEKDPDVREQLSLVAMFEGGPRPLMLRVYDDLVSGTINKQTFIETSEGLQSMWIRRAIVGRGLDLGEVGTLCREQRKLGYPIDGLITRTPEDPLVRLRLTHAPVPNVGYVLRRIQEPPADEKNLQIEHIYPQTPRDDWSGDGGETTWGDLTNDQKAKFRTVLDTIGNLTLLEGPLNGGAGNKPFHVKARDYYVKSKVLETNQLSARTSWDDEAIARRTTVLTKQFFEIWTRPGAVPMDTPDELVRLVDLSVPSGPADPDIFEYVVFDGDRWEGVHNVKALLARVGYTLSLRDREKFLGTKHGGLIHPNRTPHTKYVELPDGQLMYAAWHTHYLLEAVQESVTAFGLDDHVRAKLLASD